MKSTDSEYPPDWIEWADRDWRRVKILLAHDDAEGAAFHLQQALEKYLKGFLLANGSPLRRIHDLETLLNEASGFDASLNEFDSLCERVSNYYFTQRYPPVMNLGTTEEDIRGDMADARPLVEMIRTCVKKLSRDRGH